MYILLCNIPQTIFHCPTTNVHVLSTLPDLLTTAKPQIHSFLDLCMLCPQLWETAMDILLGAPLSQTGTEVVWDQVVEGKQSKDYMWRVSLTPGTATIQWLQQSSWLAT